MSLINDALKQANQIPAPAAQPAAPRAVGVDHRPRSAEHRPPWIALVVLPFALTVVLLLAAFFLREWWLSDGARAGKVEHNPTAVIQDAPVASAPASVVTPAAQTAPTAIVEPKLEPFVAKDTQDPAIPAEVPKPVAPAVLTYKLQGISYSATAPSAIINGTSVFVGDEVNGATVSKIEQHAVTLRIGDETKVLKMR